MYQPCHMRFLSTMIVLVAVAFPALATERAGIARFFAEIDDLPVMEGLTERPGGLVFDKPDGRLVEAYASGRLAPAAVAAFYRRTLPQLGWVRAGDLVFRRDGERLVIDFLPGDDDLSVRFMLAPE